MTVDDTTEPFVSFPCACATIIHLHSQLTPGQAAVMSCPNCALSWTVYSPSLVIKPTKDIPAEIQGVWKELSY